MMQFGLPILFTLLAWWLSTAAILYLDSLPRPTYRKSMIVASALLVLAIIGLYVTRNRQGIGSAYCAFSCSLVIWGWIEMSFLMGFITGPRKAPCPAHAAEWQRFVYAIATILYHEIAIALLAAAIVVVTWDGTNQLGTWTFVTLWCMRLSAKLNLFLGVRNFSEDFLPDHLRYLETYFQRRSLNLLFPVAVVAGTALAVFGWQGATASATPPFDAICLTFVSTLLVLAVLEHWFMVIPLPSAALWNWASNTVRDRA